ncbi:hypothetical protein ACFL1H_06065 [Nanoarchaeota archaeon]
MTLEKTKRSLSGILGQVPNRINQIKSKEEKRIIPALKTGKKAMDWLSEYVIEIKPQVQDLSRIIRGTIQSRSGINNIKRKIIIYHGIYSIEERNTFHFDIVTDPRDHVLEGGSLKWGIYGELSILIYQGLFDINEVGVSQLKHYTFYLGHHVDRIGLEEFKKRVYKNTIFTFKNKLNKKDFIIPRTLKEMEIKSFLPEIK